MGVGTYDSDFDGTGTVFSVSGPTGLGEEAYAAFLAEHEGDAPGHYNWANEVYDEFNEGVIEAVESASRELGLGIAPRTRFRSAHAGFDKEFSLLASNPVIATGWRSWQHDLVIAVAGNGRWSEWMDKGGNDDTDMVTAHGLGADMARDTYDELVNDVSEYIRLSVMEAGFECTFRTGPYTSQAYTVSKAPGDETMRWKAELRTSIKDALADLGRPLVARMAEADRKTRVQLASTIASQGLLGTAMLVPFFDRDNGVAICYDAIADYFTDAISPPDELLPYLRDLEGKDGIAPIPRDETTDTWLRVLQLDRQRQPGLIVSIDEYDEAYGEGLDVRYLDDDTKEPVEYHFKPQAVTMAP